jgi:thiamine transporter ThiT
MNDSYAECLIKRKTPVSAWLVNAMMVVLCLISLFLALTFNGFSILLFCVVSFVTYLIIRNSQVEFEYLFLDNQLSVDQIMGKAKRRQVCEISMTDIQIIAPTGSREVKDHLAGQSRIVDYASHMPHAKTYTAVVNSGSVQKQLIFEPNEAMLECFRQAAPRKVIK